jgi:hypothetical protein
VSDSPPRSKIWTDIGIGVALTLVTGVVGAVLMTGSWMAERLSFPVVAVVAVVVGVSAALRSSRSSGGMP